MSHHTIDDVLAKLDSIVDDCRRRADRRGMFAALYRRVTREVKRGIETGRFADGPRMDRLDVTFAQRYIDAYDARLAGKPTTEAWRTAFDAAERPGYLILQHLLVGMNAHINLDLGIAAARTCPGPLLADLRADYDVINQILAEQLEVVQAVVDSLSPWIAVLDWAGGRTDESIANFGIVAARILAWNTAEQLAPLSLAEQQPAIETLDCAAAKLGQAILRPGPIFATANWIVRRREASDVARIIATLAS